MRATSESAAATEADIDRRRFERQPSEIRLLVVRPGGRLAAPSNDQPTSVEGWALNVSDNGICFLCLSQITDPLVWIRTEESPDWYGEVRIVRAREVIQGLWEYGGELLRMIPRLVD